MASEDGARRPFDELVIEPPQLAGVWANHSRVTHSEHEFTLDFIRIDHTEDAAVREAILVARVAVSPLFVLGLMDTLETVWSAYAERSMPREVRGDDERGADESTADPDEG